MSQLPTKVQFIAATSWQAALKWFDLSPIERLERDTDCLIRRAERLCNDFEQDVRDIQD